MDDIQLLNKLYKNKIVMIITEPIVNIGLMNIQNSFCGMFLEAIDAGIFLLTDNNTKDFFYHNKIIKIEEAAQINFNDLNEETKKILKNTYEKHEILEKEQIKNENNGFIPDNIDPENQEKTIELLQQAQKIIRNKKLR